MRLLVLSAALAIAAALNPVLAADPIEDFYKGRTVPLIISQPPGGDYDTRARLVGRHMARHIPGKPNIVPQNMQGASGIRAANYIANIAPKDGSVLGAMDQQLPLSQAFQLTGIEFDLTKFSFVGNTSSSPIVIASWHTSPVKTFKDALTTELIIGGAAAASASVAMPRMLNVLLGTKFKVVSGYPGGNEMYLAMEKGEIGGRATQNWTGWKSQKSDWLRDKKINLLAQTGSKRHPELADVPLLLDFAKSDDDRRILEIYLAPTDIARPILLGPGVPADRVAAIRQAFDAMVVDKEFIAEADKLKVEIEATSGVEVQRTIERILQSPPNLLARAKQLSEVN